MGRILNISYDASLLMTREELLKREGFEVVSVLGFEGALKAAKTCQYDVVILGHSIPREEKRKIATEIKVCDEHIRLLSLRRHDTAPLPEADFSLDASEGPAVLVATVTEILASSTVNKSS
jgi:DNA-binding response OmpR family regulator